MIIILAVALVIIIAFMIVFGVLALFNIASLIIAIVKKQKGQIVIQSIELTLIVIAIVAVIIMYLLGGE